MQVKQIYTLVNDVTKEVLGKEGLMLEDLSNVVDVGTEIINANAVDNYVRTLVDRIGRVVFVNRPYSGGAPSVLMDGWEYGSVLEKKLLLIFLKLLKTRAGSLKMAFLMTRIYSINLRFMQSSSTLR